MRTVLSWLACASALFFVASEAVAQYTPPRDIDEMDRFRPGAVLRQAPLTGDHEISLAEAIALGLRFNLNVEVERYTPLIAQQQSEGAWGAYDPNLSADVGYAAERTPNTFSLNATRDRNAENFRTGGGASLSGLVPYLGVQLGISYDGSQTLTNSSIQTLSPEYRSDLFFDATIPLMRGLIWNEAWTNIKTSKLGYDISRENFRSSVMDTVAVIENAYWDLVATKEQLRVAQTSLDTQPALLDQTRTQYEVGVVSRVEVVEAEAGVAEGEFDRIVADNVYENSNDRLIDAILGPYLTGDSTLVFQTTDDPEDFVYYEIDVKGAVVTAFKNRPDLLAAQQNIERRGYDLKLAKNQRLPQLDLQGSYGYVGISGKSNPICLEDLAFCNFTGADQRFPDSTNDYFRDEGANNASVRAIFSIPLGNRTASRRVTQRKIEERRSKTLERQLEQQIIVDVRRAARTLDAAQRGIQASERRKAAATEQLRAERIRLEHGESTPFDVLLRLRDLVAAESQNISAFQAYRNAVTSLNRQQGTILELNNVNIEEVAVLR